MYSPVEHRQRENLHFHLVLVHNPVDSVTGSNGVQSSHNLRSGSETKITPTILTTYPNRDLQQHQQED